MTRFERIAQCVELMYWAVEQQNEHRVLVAVVGELDWYFELHRLLHEEEEEEEDVTRNLNEVLPNLNVTKIAPCEDPCGGPMFVHCYVCGVTNVVWSAFVPPTPRYGDVWLLSGCLDAPHLSVPTRGYGLKSKRIERLGLSVTE